VIDQYKKYEGCVDADNSNFYQLLSHWLFKIQVSGQQNSLLFFKIV